MLVEVKAALATAKEANSRDFYLFEPKGFIQSVTAIV